MAIETGTTLALKKEGIRFIPPQKPRLKRETNKSITEFQEGKSPVPGPRRSEKVKSSSSFYGANAENAGERSPQDSNGTPRAKKIVRKMRSAEKKGMKKRVIASK